jgi:tetratricopeptide (TPR) repeat protein
MGETPQSVTELRPDVPPPLAQLVLRCLAKDADERPQRATDIVRVLETVTSSAGHEAMPMILAGGRGMFRKAMLFYVIAFIVVAVVAKAAIVAVGLPDWVFPGALVMMALGLPVILFTAYVHRTTRRILSATPTYTPGGTPSLAQGTMAQVAMKASPHVSWRRAAIGGVVAVGGFVLLVGAYMALRALGIGPAGSLLAQGALAKDEKILVADLASPAGDSTLGPVVTDAFRTALGQSQSVSVVQPSTVNEVLRRMERPANSRVDFALAREIATREGIKGVIDGSLLGVGGRYVLAVRLVSAQTGDELASFRETAANQSELLPAVDRLAKEVRAKIGESLKNVQSAPPLEQVTTSSLEALKKYVQGVKVIGEEGDFQRGAALLQEAVAMDTAFAMAYRKLGVEYGNRGFTEKAISYYEKAYQHRDRLSDAERYLLLGSYYQFGKDADRSKAKAAYEQLLDIQPTITAGLINLANEYLFDHQYARAESLLTVAVRVGPVAPVHFLNLARARFFLGRPDSARAAAMACVATFPKNLKCEGLRADVYWATGRFDSSLAVVDRVASRVSQPEDRVAVLAYRGNFARLHGRVAEAERLATQEADARGQLGETGATLAIQVERALDLVWLLGDASRAEQVVREALSAQPIDRVPVSEAPYLALVTVHALAGEPAQAKAAMTEWYARVRTSPTFRDSSTSHRMGGLVALAEHRYADAAREFRASDAWECPSCAAAHEGRARQLAGDTTGAISAYERLLTIPFLDRGMLDAMYLPSVNERLAKLYDAKGERAKALEHFRAFIELWKDADPELQPRVAEARRRMAALERR